MDILTSNQTTTRKFTIELQESKDKWKSLRQGIRDKIAETATTQARLMLSEEDDIGNPAQLCEVLSKLRLEYTEITVQEKEEQAKIMQEYTNQTIINMKRIAASTDDAIKLKVYENYIQTSCKNWDLLLQSNVAIPSGSVQLGHVWLTNFRHTINAMLVKKGITIN